MEVENVVVVSTCRYSMIVEAVWKMKQRQFSIDGEICVMDLRGISQFGWLHSGRYNVRLD